MDGSRTRLGTHQTDRQSLFLLVGVCLLTACLRLNQAGVIPLRADEAANFYLAVKPPQAIIRPLIASDPHLPFFYIILHYWMLLAGSSELSLRYLTIFSAVVAVPLVYALGRRLFPRSNIAWIGAFLAAINPYSIWDAQDAYMYALLTATGLASFIAFIRVIRPKASRLAWATYVGVSALALYEHYLAGLVLVAEGAVWLLWTVTRTIGWRTSLRWVGAQLAIAVLFTPWLVMVLPLLRTLDSPIWRQVGLTELVVRTFIAFSLGRVEGLGMPAMVEQLNGLLGAVPFAVLLLLGLLVPSRSPRSDLRERILLAVYLFVPLLAFFLFTQVRFPVFDERYVLFLIAPFLLLVARGVVVLHERTGHAGIAALAILVVVFLTAHSLYNYWYVPSYAKSPDWPGFVARLDADYRQGDVLIQNYPDAALPYYLHDGVPSVLVPGRSSAQMTDVATRLEDLTRNYKRIWFQPVVGGNWDTDGLVAMWLDRHAQLVSSYSFRGLRLQLYLTSTAALRSARPTGTLFSNEIRLVGFDLTITDNPGPGTTARVVLFWQAIKPGQRDATVFLHLYDQQGRLLAQQDNQPVHDSYPTHEWIPGEIVVDPYELPIPADLARGEYAVVVGMYDSESEERVPILESQAMRLSQNRVLLTNLDVK